MKRYLLGFLLLFGFASAVSDDRYPMDSDNNDTGAFDDQAPAGVQIINETGNRIKVFAGNSGMYTSILGDNLDGDDLLPPMTTLFRADNRYPREIDLLTDHQASLYLKNEPRDRNRVTVVVFNGDDDDDVLARDVFTIEPNRSYEIRYGQGRIDLRLVN